MSSARRHDTDSDDDSAQQSRCKSNSRGARNFSEGDDNDFASDTIERIEECFSDDPDHFQDGFRDDQSEGPPSLVSSSGDDEDDQRDRDEFLRQGREDFIRDSRELFNDDRKSRPASRDAPAVRAETQDETEEDQKSRERLAQFTRTELVELLLTYEKEKVALRKKDVLHIDKSPRKIPFTPPPGKSAKRQDYPSDSESVATDSTKSTRHRSSSPWRLVNSYSHSRMSQDEIRKALEKRAGQLMLEGGQYASKKQNEKDLGPFKFNQVMLFSIYIFLVTFS